MSTCEHCGMWNGPEHDCIPSKKPDGWIKCSERMPEPGHCYITVDCVDESSMDIRYLSDDYADKKLRWSNAIDELDPVVTHWMPLPPTPEAK